MEVPSSTLKVGIVGTVLNDDSTTVVEFAASQRWVNCTDAKNDLRTGVARRVLTRSWLPHPMVAQPKTMGRVWMKKQLKNFLLKK